MTSRQRSMRPDGGMPGDGAGRREEPGTTGVHLASAGWPDEEMTMRSASEWGQGERGATGYDDSGTSELAPSPGSAEPSGITGQPTGRSVVGEPGPADEANAALETHPHSVAGAPGPTDEANAALDTRSKPIAGQPGPADEANAALKTEDVSGTEGELGRPESGHGGAEPAPSSGGH